jgi:hypothetical protein
LWAIGRQPSANVEATRRRNTRYSLDVARLAMTALAPHRFVAALGLASLLGGPAAFGATPYPSATRAYSGSIFSGTGLYSNAGGRVNISLVETQATPWPVPPLSQPGPEYTFTVTLRGARCRRHARHTARRRRCLRLDGSITGSAIRLPHNPDVAPTDQIITASGHTNVLGAVTVTGAYHGTGFVPRGHASIGMTLTGRSGAVPLGGDGPPIRGFQAP